MLQTILTRSDLLYINNHDGTFTNKANYLFQTYFSNAMGKDVIDMNNDGLSDVVELDMNPEDNYRKKTMLGVQIITRIKTVITSVISISMFAIRYS